MAASDRQRQPPAPLVADGVGTLADQASAQLEDMIVTLQFPPGTEITEKQVCDRLGMGRTPVREALLRLRHAGLIESSPGRRHVVSRLLYEEILQVLEVGGLLARLVIPRAAKWRSAPEARRFQSLADAFLGSAEAGDLPRYMQLYLALQELVAATARQPVASRLGQSLTSVTRRLIVVHFRLRGDTLRAFAPLHAGLARALADGDPAEAAARLDTLLTMWIEVIESLATEPALRDLSTGLPRPR